MLDGTVSLIKQRVVFNGVSIAGDNVPGFAVWLCQKLSFTGDAIAQQTALLNWLNGLTQVYEADDAVRMKAAASVQQAPPNAISSQVTPQQMAPPVAAPPPATAETQEEPNAPVVACPDPSCKTTTKGLRGMKRHVTQTHQADFGGWGISARATAPTPRPGCRVSRLCRRPSRGSATRPRRPRPPSPCPRCSRPAGRPSRSWLRRPRRLPS